jgi:hypothetical protein
MLIIHLESVTALAVILVLGSREFHGGFVVDMEQVFIAAF